MPKRFIDPVMLGPLCLVLLIWQLSVPAHAQAQPQVYLTEKNVLILHSHEANAPVFAQTDRGLSTALQFGGIPSLNQFFESLDLRRTPGPEYRKLLVEQMRAQYSHRKLDMIITMYPEALEFVLKDCRDILPDVPILALYLPQRIELPRTDRRIIGHSATPDIIGTLEIALKLVPQAKRVYVVSGAHEVDRRLEGQARRISKKWEGQVEFLYLSHMPFEDMLATISSTPPGSIILLMAFSHDVTGKSKTTPEVAQRVSQVSKAPIFGILDVTLGHGIAGGSLISFELIGTKAGELVLNILRGGPTEEDFPKVLDVACVPMFDWRQIRHWKLSETALPKGSIVINKETTLWDFRYYIIGTLVFCLLETALIIILIVQRRRKKVAEEGLLRKTEELDQFFNVSMDLLCIANTDGYFLRLNPVWERILGYSREELMAKRFLDLVHPDDSLRTQEAVSAQSSGQRVIDFENRYRCKDGTYRWLEWSSVPAGNLIYAAARDITERHRAEEDLKRSEERFRMLVETMTEGFGAGNEDYVWTYVNDQLSWMLGLLPGDIIGRPIAEFLDEANRSVFGEVIQKQKKGDYSPYEMTWTRTDGRKVTTIVSPKPIFNPEGQIKEAYAVITDITERKRMEEALRESEKEAKQVAREALVRAEVGRIISSTLTVEEVYEPFAAAVKRIIPFDRIVINTVDSEKGTFTNAYMAGAEIGDREAGKAHTLEGSGMAEMLRTKSPFLLQDEDFTDYQERFPILLSTFQAGFRSILNVPLVNQGRIIGGLLLRSFEPHVYTDEHVRLAERIGNQIAGAIANAQLYLKQKQTEEALRESEDRFRQVAESVGDFIWEVDAEGLYRYTSPSVEKILGYRPDELIGKKHFYDLFVPEVREELKAATLTAFAGKQPFRAFSNPNVSKNGRVVQLETSGLPIVDQGGNLVGYRGADTDVTERKQAEAEVNRAREQLFHVERSARMGELTASLAHELNQPLAAILSNAQAALRFLQSDQVDLDEFREILHDIIQDDQRAGNVIRSLRSMMKREERERNPIILNTVLNDVVRIFHTESIFRNVHIDTEFDESLPPVLADRVQLQQVVLNLVVNAADAMSQNSPEYRKIIMGTQVKNDRIRVTIRDFGPGIDQGNVDRIFQAFFTTKGTGLGMGLAVSQTIVEAHGGHIWAENNPDAGATFFIELPIYESRK